MTLVEQLYSLIYHFISGQVFAFIYSFLSICTLSFTSKNKVFLYSIFTLTFTTLYYYGLFYINGGITNFYLFFIFGLGLFLYYRFFYIILLPIFLKIKQLICSIQKQLFFAKIKIYGIMTAYEKKKRRLSLNGQRKNTKNEKDENH